MAREGQGGYFVFADPEDGLEWSAGTIYVRGQIVTNSGNTYLCTQAHVAGSSFGDESALWILISGSGGGGVTGGVAEYTHDYTSVGEVSSWFPATADLTITPFTTDSIGCTPNIDGLLIPRGWLWHAYVNVGLTLADAPLAGDFLHLQPHAIASSGYFPPAFQPLGAGAQAYNSVLFGSSGEADHDAIAFDPAIATDQGASFTPGVLRIGILALMPFDSGFYLPPD